MSADGLEDFQAVLEQLSVHLKISAPDLWTAEAEIFETRHNYRSAGHILAMVAHNMDILSLGCW
jgi:hypothetical protein